MERGNSKLNPRVDEELKHELQGYMQGNRPTRAEEWRDPEPPPTMIRMYRLPAQ